MNHKNVVQTEGRMDRKMKKEENIDWKKMKNQKDMN